jgi:hypothetical protein
VISGFFLFFPVVVGAAVVTVPYKGPRQIQDLEAHGAQWLAFTKDGVDFEAQGEALDYLLSQPWGVKRVVESLAPPPGAAIIDANLGLYHTYDETEAALGALVAGFPSLADTLRIGRAYGPTFRNITVIKISDHVGTDENEPEVLYSGCHHARELMSVEIPLMFATYLLQNYGVDPVVTNYVDTREIFILPILNPDGLAYVQANHTGANTTWWRKNRRNNGNGTFGVDLNRNYSYQWGYDNTGSSPTTSAETYRGPGAFSEPETQALRDFCASRHFSLWLSYHTYGELLLYPWGYVPEYTDDHKVFALLGAELGAGTGYVVGNTALGAIYLTNGGSDDWAYGEIAAKNRIVSFTAETNNTGQGGFAPAESYIQPTFDFLLGMNLALLEYADDPRRVLGPEKPQQYAIQAPYANGVNRISWSAGPPSDPNPAASYEVEACLNPSFSVDPCTPSLEGWENEGFAYTASGSSGGGYDAGTGDRITHFIRTPRPVRVDADLDTLRFQVTYSIEANFDYGYVDVSTDGGFIWTPVQGNITTSSNPNSLNRGHGFTGTSAGWVDAVFPLTAYLGEEVLVRIAYITDGAVLGTGVRVDNIDPLVQCESLSVVADAVADTVFVHAPSSTGLWRYRVRARDAQGQYSEWSNQQERAVPTLTGVALPRRFESSVGANYPNPFNPSTRIPYTVGGREGARAVRVVLGIYDVTGARVATLVNDARTPGTYVAAWTGRDDRGRPAASGIYFARLEVDGSAPFVRKLVLLK